MPHIKDEQKDKVHQSSTPEKEGDLCFLFSDAALIEYNKNPRWSSIHQIRKALRSPYHAEWSHAVIMQYMGTYTRQDIETAADLAFFEFYRIIGARYEDGMIAQNGNAFKGAKIPSLGEGVEVARDNTLINVLAPSHVVVVSEPKLTPAQLLFQTPEPAPVVVLDRQGDLTLAQVTPVEVVATKKRGRPFGSKNKVKEVA